MTECAKEVDIPKDERLTLSSDEIRPLSYTSEGRRKQKVVFKETEKESEGEGL